MQVEYVSSRSIKVKPAQLYRLGNSLVLQIGKTEHRILLQETQWSLLAESANNRARECQERNAHAQTNPR